MKLTHIYMLHAKRTDMKHDFIELFTNMEQLELFLLNHPTIIKCEISIHEINPN